MSGKNAPEWVILGISSLVVPTMIVVLVVTVIGWEWRPPELEAKPGAPKLKHYIVKSLGGGDRCSAIAPSDVEIEVTRNDGGMERSASVDLDCIPRKEPGEA